MVTVARHLPRLALAHLDCPILGDGLYGQVDIYSFMAHVDLGKE